MNRRRDRRTAATGGTAPRRRHEVGTVAGPVWSRIAASLASDIATGRLAGGVRIDSEHRLAARFGVNRHTVRRALQHLAAQGALRVVKGSGTFVEELAVGYALGPQTRFSENLARSGLDARHVVLDAAVIAAPEDVARRLALRRGTRVVRLRTRGEAIARGEPVLARALGVSEHFFPARRFPTIADRVVETGSISRALAAFGVTTFRRSASWITARLPDADAAQALRQPIVRPVLCVESLNVDAAGVPIELGRTQFAGDAVQLVVDHGH